MKWNDNYSSLRFTKDNRIRSSIVSLSIFTFSDLTVSTATGFNGTFVGCLMWLKSIVGLFAVVDEVLYARATLYNTRKEEHRLVNELNMILCRNEQFLRLWSLFIFLVYWNNVFLEAITTLPSTFQHDKTQNFYTSSIVWTWTDSFRMKLDIF